MMLATDTKLRSSVKFDVPIHREKEWGRILCLCATWYESRAPTEHLRIKADDEMLAEGMDPQGLRRASAGMMRTGWQTT
jgi:hypothetical protein